ncbi:MAG: aminoglycoside phosphotransferase family protein [Ruminococcaceae bacterium]|nr:aminoglycoside phosphotransferase family protein [Oscillospiraceae bacterium]
MSASAQALAFQITGQPVSCDRCGSGHINNTFLVTTDTGHKYVMQRINKYVFKEPVKVMANIAAVTEHLRKKVSDPRGALHFIPTHDGSYTHQDGQGEYWRVYEFVDGFCLDAPESDRDFYESALAFGQFQALLADFPAHTLYETIPNFHNTVDRYRQLNEAIAQNSADRAACVKEEITCAMGFEEMACRLQHMLEENKLPLRVTHNDTKLNNVLLDPVTRKHLCVLDLDTVMPGLSVHDFGDSIRFGAATAAEDAPDPSQMKLDLSLFRIYTQGFLEAATGLTPLEVEMLPMGAFTMTVEVGIRFLADYLNGDVYFKTAYPEHNLVRARTQLALAADMLKNWEQMEQTVRELSATV